MRNAVSAVAPVLALGLSMGGCGGEEMVITDPPDEEDPFLPGFEFEPAEANEVQFVTPILEEIAPGVDVTLCTYLDYTVSEDFDVTHFEGFQSHEGHHALLYGAAMNMPAGTHVCNEADMFNTHFLGSVGGADGAVNFDIPEGIGFRVHSGTQIMIQTHWINASDTPVRGQALFNIVKQAPSDAITPADLFADVTTELMIPVGEGGTGRSECTVGEPIDFFLMSGHAHEWGTNVKITVLKGDGDAEEVIYDEPWGPAQVFDSKILWYEKDAPLSLKPGDTLRVDCTYNNTTGEMLYFPSEMCVAFGYYFPATRQLNCVNNVWPGL